MTLQSDFSAKITKVKTALENVFVKKTDIQNNLTSTDTNKPLSANQGKILDTNKVDKISGKSLSTNDFTNTYKTKLDNLDTLLESKANNIHTHGNITNDGKCSTTGTVDVSRGDLLLFADATSNQYTIKGSTFIDALNDLILDLIDEGES